MKHLFILLALGVTLYACNEHKPVPINKFSDTLLVQIAEFQDRRLSDSLYHYLESENSMYRHAAALAFSSVQDTIAIDKLWEMLVHEKDPHVRQVIVYALGQTGTSKVYEKFFRGYREADRQVLKETFETLGKVAEAQPYDAASSVIPPLYHLLQEAPEDSLLLEGKLWGMYRLALRNISISQEQWDKFRIKDPSMRSVSYSDSLLAAITIPYLDKKFSLTTRLGATHTLSRGRVIDLSPYYLSLAEAVKDGSGEVRMAVAAALRKVKGESVVNTLGETILKDADYRVRVNAIRALQSFPFEQTKDILIQSLNDENTNVGIAASEVMKATATEKFWNELLLLARSSKNWRIQANLYEAALAANDYKELAEEIAAAAKKSFNPYQKAALITALRQSVMSFGFVQEQLFKADTPVVRSSAASALTSMNKHKNFDHSLKKRFADIYVKATQTGDAAVIGIIAEALADSTLGYKSVLKDFTFLYDAKNKLSLPKDNEALQPLETAIAYFEGRKNTSTVKNDFNHPINWTLVRSIPHDQKVVIQTSRGNITIRLLVEEATGSVANFVELVNRHYFDNKFFHRVVPNFVIQAGCNRGDGWGSEDYSIRSEFSSRRYKAGSVGMASAGKDTEGTQWFITHSSTPHLDGRYTIFAEVERGMDVVHQIEVGDKILEVSLIK